MTEVLYFMEGSTEDETHQSAATVGEAQRLDKDMSPDEVPTIVAPPAEASAEEKGDDEFSESQAQQRHRTAGRGAGWRSLQRQSSAAAMRFGWRGLQPNTNALSTIHTRWACSKYSMKRTAFCGPCAVCFGYEI